MKMDRKTSIFLGVLIAIFIIVIILCSYFTRRLDTQLSNPPSVSTSRAIVVNAINPPTNIQTVVKKKPTPPAPNTKLNIYYLTQLPSDYGFTVKTEEIPSWDEEKWLTVMKEEAKNNTILHQLDARAALAVAGKNDDDFRTWIKYMNDNIHQLQIKSMLHPQDDSYQQKLQSFYKIKALVVVIRDHLHQTPSPPPQPEVTDIQI